MKIFEEVPQCVPIEATEDQVNLKWNKEPAGYTLLLH